MEKVLKDKSGNKIGTIKQDYNKDIIYDRSGNKLGYFDGRYTYDRSGNKIGEGDLLVTLLSNNR